MPNILRIRNTYLNKNLLTYIRVIKNNSQSYYVESGWNVKSGELNNTYNHGTFEIEQDAHRWIRQTFGK